MRKIDAVIPWVEGNDPRHQAKRIEYGGNGMVFKSDDCAGESRYANIGEIFWCVASLNRFAPWLNKIYIVTDEQDPGMDSFLKENFPGGYIPVEIVDHKAIFEGYEQYLPTFNSISIESMTWRIPGLSDYYIELNDDFILMNDVTPEDFIAEDGKLLCYSTKTSRLWTYITRCLKKRINGRKQVTFKGVMLNAARLVSNSWYFLEIGHTPRILSRKFFEEYYSKNADLLKRNISHRFRHAEQFTPPVLQYMSLHKEGKCELRPITGNLFFLQPKNKSHYVDRKLARLERMPSCKFGCFNSLNLANDEDQNKIIAWIKTRSGLK